MLRTGLQNVRRALTLRSKKDNGKGKGKDMSAMPALPSAIHPLDHHSYNHDNDNDDDNSHPGHHVRSPVSLVESRFLTSVEEISFNIPMSALTEYMYCVEDVVVSLLAYHPLVTSDFDLLCQFIVTPYTAPQVAINTTATSHDDVVTEVIVDQGLLDEVFVAVMSVAPRLRTREAAVSFQLFFGVRMGS